MAAIQALVAPGAHAHHARITDADYTAIGQKVDVEIQKMFAECKLAPDPDAALHDVLAQMMAGSKLMQAGEGARGAADISSALETYREIFE
jgi:hypothetical protein